MRADYRVLLDACVLIPMPLADTLLRMAEAPRLYLPKWSQAILDEVRATSSRSGAWSPKKHAGAKRQSGGIFRKHWWKALSP